MKKNQHYLPKAYLNFFANDGNKKTKMIYAYFISQKKTKYVSTDDICSKKFLYEHKVATESSSSSDFIEPNLIEDSFVEFESWYATLVKHIVNEITASNKITIYPEDRGMLAHCFSIFQCRHPDFVKISDYVTKEVTLKDEKMIEFIKTEMAGECDELIAASVLHEQL